MHDCGNLIHKVHNLGLEHFSRIREIPDITEPKHRHNLLPLEHRIDRAMIFYIFSDDLTAGLAKPHRQQRPNLHNHIFQNNRFGILLLSILLLPQRRLNNILILNGDNRLERVLRNPLHSREHILEWLERIQLHIPRKQQTEDDDNDTDE